MHVQKVHGCLYPMMIFNNIKSFMACANGIFHMTTILILNLYISILPFGDNSMSC
jgi:hypothetical protein